MKEYSVAVAGVTGAVGQKLLEILEAQDKFAIKEFRPMASARSAGKKVEFRGEEIEIIELTEDAFEGVDIAFFSAGGSVSEKFAPIAVKAGAVVIDNTSAYRMDENTPLVVPQVNPEALENHQGIIANPNCSTIQMMVALNPIRKAYGMDRVIISTYQAVSGAGNAAINETLDQTKAILTGEEVETNILPVGGDEKHYQMAFNVLPQIDKFTDNHFTFEEMKMRNETRKIFDDQDIKVTATCVRVPVIYGHSESVYIEVNQDGLTIEDIQNILKDAPGLVLQDDIDNQLYPQPIEAAGSGETYVGRIRKDLDIDNGFHLWIVSDNIVKGAALNSVEIAQKMVEKGLI